jgi:hypothetical protein
MSEAIEVGAVSLIQFFATRAQEYALAAQYTKSQTLAVANAKSVVAAQDVGGTDLSPRTITLQLTQSQIPNNSNNTATGSGQGGPQVTRTITFDIGRVADAYLQSFEIASNARQTVHQTAVGFYVDEFNEGTGTLTLEAEVIYSGSAGTGSIAAAQVQQFFDFLHASKLTDPLANEAPSRLLYIDSYLNRSLIITQDGIRFRAEADKPGRGMLSINATILYDYSGSNPAQAQSVAELSVTDMQAVTNLFPSLGTMITPDGSSVG